MHRYLVEGYYFSKTRSKKSTPALEPFARYYWAESQQDAIQMATEDLHGGCWQKPPRASQTSEEQRMREQGQPELPGFGSQKVKKPIKVENRASKVSTTTNKRRKIK